MRIAICDDELSCCEKITNLIREYGQAKPDLSFTSFSFSSGQELLSYADAHGGFDLYILDIVMPGQNGIELASALRDRKDAGMVVYLTTSPDFAVDSYKVKAFDYLLKPIDKTEFFSVMDEAEAYFLRRTQENISVKTSDSVRMIPIRDILYAERTGKRICYHIIGNETIYGITFNDSFKNAVSGLLAYKGMLLVGSSFAVNLFHVTEVKKTSLIVAGKHPVPIPRRLYETVKKEWAKYWLDAGQHNHISDNPLYPQLKHKN